MMLCSGNLPGICTHPRITFSQKHCFEIDHSSLPPTPSAYGDTCRQWLGRAQGRGSPHSPHPFSSGTYILRANHRELCAVERYCSVQLETFLAVVEEDRVSGT